MRRPLPLALRPGGSRRRRSLDAVQATRRPRPFFFDFYRSEAGCAPRAGTHLRERSECLRVLPPVRGTHELALHEGDGAQLTAAAADLREALS
ncbi:hypothetical protein [Pseudoroseicyclus aestuarii]|uniref:Uncharacterized protein n=1 Tax=Pseudoroseicyclus aestuarii TaxID=1795041 RepID=A0A318T322_9RHOB|nr:hypothetical protein [Pseudoroseicyclus aestuarii]PYE80384.1 hypothetical protein DFP88_1184 [Pseudoroseicyclus aestuarii]